ncbi:BREX-3 system phosphatase PglZ [Ruegeria arenilitoris]|uniref:BREX-3 system phosphatase PglZ n=1 Tax=Ruegeria arenilitoris TaxID=1173585 RepID=UPI001C983B25|nr:BREX-3 system phosphatase PglZ [Ruegeria arenilitoris]MBY6083618.1 BREX-3 system phosphatase PglZ [Ruegeria arenilitoris]
MSAWIDRILQEFPADLSRFWIACDPDDLLLDERILHGLRERGFEVLPFEDSVAFRTEYEERYRAAWDRGEEGPSKALVLQLCGTDLADLPWDYTRFARTVFLSLANLFPSLNPGVVRQLSAEHHEELFLAHQEHASQTLGEKATKDFILTHIFGISPSVLKRPEDFWRELLRLHYRGAALPNALAAHVAAILKNTPLGELPVENLLSSKSYAMRVIQDSWVNFLSKYEIESARITSEDTADRLFNVPIPFEHPDVRLIIDTMFLDGTLQPIPSSGSGASIPDWVRIGLVDDPNAFGTIVAEGVKQVAGDLPTADATHRDWVETARRLGEVISRLNNLNPALAEPIENEVRNLQYQADERLKDWIVRNFANLSSLPAANGPVMVHHVPRYLALRRLSGEDRVALLVVDGLAMDQWVQIREHLADAIPGFAVDESGCFAWLPTLTSVSRQALFSGLKPREFASSIETTSKEPALWARFWQDHDLRPSEIFFKKGLKKADQLVELEEEISNPKTKAVGLVVDMIDEIVHGAMLGKRGVAGQIKAWCETGFISRLLLLLTDHGYQVYLTADHGNVDATGIGRLNQGATSELRGQRVRTYRSEGLAASVPSDMDTFRLNSAGLPPDFLPVYASGRGAFVPKGDQIVAHGGASVEELIVPFAKITITRTEQ